MTSEKYEMKRTLESHKRRIKILEEQTRVIKRALDIQVGINLHSERIVKTLELITMEQSGIKKILFDLREKHKLHLRKLHKLK